MNFSMKNDIFRIVKKYLIPIVFWLLIWELLALWVDHYYFFPHALDVFTALVKLVFNLSTYKTILVTLLRVLAGIIVGVILGVLTPDRHQNSAPWW